MLLCRYLAGIMLALVYRWFLMPDSLGHLLFSKTTTLSTTVQKLSSARFRRGGRACLLLPTFCRGAERKEKKIVDEAHRIDSLPKYLN